MAILYLPLSLFSLQHLLSNFILQLMKMLLISLRKTKATASKCPFPPISPIHLPLSVLIYSAFSLLWLWKKRLRLCLYTRLKASYKVLFRNFSLLTPPSVAFYSLLFSPYQYKSVRTMEVLRLLNLQVLLEHATVSWLLTKAQDSWVSDKRGSVPTATAAARRVSISLCWFPEPPISTWWSKKRQVTSCTQWTALLERNPELGNRNTHYIGQQTCLHFALGGTSFLSSKGVHYTSTLMKRKSEESNSISVHKT